MTYLHPTHEQQAAVLEPEPVASPAPRYHHDYSRTLTQKVLLQRKEGGQVIHYSEVMEIVRFVHRLTRGLPQVLYLIGWQHGGHDSKYPDLGAVNPTPADGDGAPLEQLRRLIRDARRYNATISLHVNHDDAYPNSPLWQTYLDADAIMLDAEGKPKPGSVWGGETSYHVLKSKALESGLLQQQVGELLAMVPELTESATIHVDAFRPYPQEPHAAVTTEDERRAAHAIVAYWRRKGFDFTTEFLSDRSFIGTIPMVWHANFSESDRLAYPPSVLCGGGCSWNVHDRSLDDMPPWTGFFVSPAGGCRYEKAWGYSLDRDWIKDADGTIDWQWYRDTILGDALPFVYLNQGRPISCHEDKDQFSVTFSHDVVSTIHKASGDLVIEGKDGVVQEGSRLSIPVDWNEDGGRIDAQDQRVGKQQNPNEGFTG